MDRTLPSRLCLLLTSLAASALARAQFTSITPDVPADRAFTVALDPGTSRVLMYGGRLARTAVGDNHLWHWDGSTWRLDSGTGPAGTPRVTAFDAARRRLVVLLTNGQLWEWDGSSWSQRGNAPFTGTPQLTHMFADGSRTLLLVDQGGYRMFAWDGSAWSTLSTSGPARRDGPCIGTDLHGNLLLFAGGDYNTFTQTWTLRQDLHLWNGFQWIAIPTAAPWPAARMSGCVGFDEARGRWVLTAGATPNYLPIPGVDEWDGTTWSHANASPAGLAGPLVWQPSRQRLTLFANPGPMQEWDGANWQEVQPRTSDGTDAILGSAPGVLAFERSTGTAFRWVGRHWQQVGGRGTTPMNSFAFDTARGVAVNFENSTFEWAPATGWVARAATGEPPIRLAPSMGYDEQRNRVILYGGTTPSYQDTWEYDGVGWTFVNPPTRPTVSNGTLGFDPVSRSMLMVGGPTTAGVFVNSAWNFNGTTWSARATPPASSIPFFGIRDSLAIDRLRNRLVLYRSTGDMALWTGTGWQALPAFAPSALGIGFDAPTGELILFTTPNGGVDHGFASRIAIGTPTAVAAYGLGCAADTQPVLTSTMPMLGNAHTLLDVHAAGAGNACLLGLADQQGSTPIGGGCSLLLAGTTSLRFTTANAAGVATVELAIPALPALRGRVLFAQAGVLQSTGVALTSALALTIGD